MWACPHSQANEMADVNLQDYAAANSEVRFLIGYRDWVEKTHGVIAGEPKTQPLRDSKGRPLLQDAFEHIDADYGSVANYLERARYLE